MRWGRPGRSDRPGPGGDSSTALLTPATLARLERLQLATSGRLGGRSGGEHRSRRQGASLDFVDHRDYAAGDDLRHLDMGAFTRLGLLLVRLFEADDDVTVRLVLDTSASMGGTGRNGVSKLRRGAQLAAALGFVSLVRRDPVTLHAFPYATPSPRFSGRSAAVALFEHLGRLEAAGPTEVAAATSALLARPGPRGMTILVSDLLSDDWARAVRRLPASGAELVVVHVLTAAELHPALSGRVEFVDAELGGVLPLDLTPAAVADYEAVVAAWRADVAATCRHVGATYLPVLVEDDLEAVLVSHWQRAGLLR